MAWPCSIAHRALPEVKLPGDCQLTLLSPDANRLLELKTAWDKVLRKAKWKSGDAATVMRALHASRTLKPLGDVLGDEGGDDDADLAGRFELPDPLGRDELAAPGDTLGGDEDAEPGGTADFGSDTSEANGSSIALLLEFPAKDPAVRLLLAGDAWAGVLEASVDQLLAARGGSKLKLDAFKLPHHGSVANISPTLVDKLRCPRYLVSTSGAIFRHPHARAIDLLVDHSSARGQDAAALQLPERNHAGLGRCQRPGGAQVCGGAPQGNIPELVKPCGPSAPPRTAGLCETGARRRVAQAAAGTKVSATPLLQ